LLVTGQGILSRIAIGFAEYDDALTPGLNMMLVAAGVMVLCFVINLFGVRTVARFQVMLIIGPCVLAEKCPGLIAGSTSLFELPNKVGMI
jgi:amino acid transporter